LTAAEIQALRVTAAAAISSERRDLDALSITATAASSKAAQACEELFALKEKLLKLKGQASTTTSRASAEINALREELRAMRSTIGHHNNL
jgi:chromosomal replication initiation ATPase DnaA